MAKLIFQYAEILDSAGASLTPNQYIRNITVDGIEASNEASEVVVENDRAVNESFTGNITLRSTDTSFSQVNGVGAETDILASDYISNDGTTPTEGRLRLVGKSGTHDLTTGTTYLQGKKMFDNSRLETMVMAQASDVDESVSMAVQAGSA